MSTSSQKNRTWNIGDLEREVVALLESGLRGAAPMIDGRALLVKASPFLGNSTRMAVGMSALPAGFRRTVHTHDSEEAAIVVSGTGYAEVAEIRHCLEPGTLVLAPAGVPHVVASGEDGPLVMLWIYAPPGSELPYVGDRAGQV